MKPNNKMIADLNMFRNLMAQQPYMYVANALIYDSLLASTPFYNPEGNEEVYLAARSYVLENYDVEGMFAD